MHRVRMSLPYFVDYDLNAEIVTVDEKYVDLIKDPLLSKGIPGNIKIHYVKALSKKWTSKLGLRSIALRSLWFYKRKVNQILKTNKFDLIYFSTTQFPVLILGTYWKKKFNIPFVIDMQDPWHSDYYEDKPKHEKPAKYWFSYRLNKYLEPIAMKNVDGLISVSQAYLDTLEDRYPCTKEIPKQVITFAAFEPDFDFVRNNKHLFASPYQSEEGCFNFVYVGRGGHDMKAALTLLFTAFKRGLIERPSLFEKIRFQFIGTSYATTGEGTKTIEPLAYELGISAYVNEQTDRIPYYQNIYTLAHADALLIVGSDDPQYTASKIYPYILANKPILSFFHPKSSATQIIQDCNAGVIIPLSDKEEHHSLQTTYQTLADFASFQYMQKTDWCAFEPYSAKNMAKQQTILFNKIITK